MQQLLPLLGRDLCEYVIEHEANGCSRRRVHIKSQGRPSWQATASAAQQAIVPWKKLDLPDPFAPTADNSELVGMRCSVEAAV